MSIALSQVPLIQGQKALTDNTAVGIFEVALPAGSSVGGFVVASVKADDATDFQSHADYVSFAAVNKAGAYTTQITSSNAGDAIATSSGTLAVSWSITTGTDKITIEVNANTSLTATTLLVDFNIIQIDGQIITLL